MGINKMAGSQQHQGSQQQQGLLYNLDSRNIRSISNRRYVRAAVSWDETTALRKTSTEGQTATQETLELQGILTKSRDPRITGKPNN
jgi:hypothetical protein